MNERVILYDKRNIFLGICNALVVPSKQFVWQRSLTWSQMCRVKRPRYSRLLQTRHNSFSSLDYILHTAEGLRTKDEEEVNAFDSKSQHKQEAHVEWQEHVKRREQPACLPAGQMVIYVNPTPSWDFLIFNWLVLSRSTQHESGTQKCSRKYSSCHVTDYYTEVAIGQYKILG